MHALRLFAVGAAIGGLIAAVMLDRIGRKITVAGFYLLAALSMLTMAAKASAKPMASMA